MACGHEPSDPAEDHGPLRGLGGAQSASPPLSLRSALPLTLRSVRTYASCRLSRSPLSGHKPTATIEVTEEARDGAIVVFPHEGDAIERTGACPQSELRTPQCLQREARAGDGH